MPIRTKSRIPALLFLLATLVASSASSRGALLLHYKLDEGSGTTVADSAAAPANGTFVGAGSSWTTDTPSGSGYAWRVNDSSGSYVSAGAGAVGKLEGLGDFTITFWMDLSAISATTDRIFSTRGTDNAAGWLDLLATSTDLSKMTLTLNLKSPDASSQNAVSDAFDASGGWVFVAITRTASTGTVTFYTGDTATSAASALTVAGTTTGLSSATTINKNSAEFRLGGTASTSQNRSPSGDFSDFRIYAEALGQPALNAIRLQALPAIPEPSGVALLMGGAAASGWLLRRRKLASK
ncbi:MAG: LamG domain-containing protein [Opitutaceae bacterium]|jgi:hypothetical protein|nr:LamG domain-containing protein [Opitutaceae bacterium]